MTPGARLSAAAEVLDALARERVPADEVLRAWGRAHRFAGSKDRRAIAERVYDALRARARVAWRMGADDGRALVLGSLLEVDGLSAAEVEALFTGEGHAPAPLSHDERARLTGPPPAPPAHVRAGVPAFVAELLETGFGGEWEAEARALIGARAPLDLRLNTLRGGREAALRLLAVDGLEPAVTPWSALGLRLPAELAPDIGKTRAWLDGWVEVQDEASQVAAALAGAAPGMTVVDYCAGGGGKTLALAAMMGLRAAHSVAFGDSPPSGGACEVAREAGGRGGSRLVACDVNAKRLAALAPRLARAGAAAEVRRMGAAGEGTADLEGRADLVFVDAPCSGSGTWRRHPEAAWRLTPETVARLAELQGVILARAARLVAPGGRLVYATCSVFAAENAEVADAFAVAHPQFRPLPVAEATDTPSLTPAARERLASVAASGHRLQLTPRRTGTDGFFAALFTRAA
ncbi:MAG: RsmB/NOP family class I SAM-dependent RNA methyltransferase [Caulobacteraceae bacterium]|nr:RsmB/NOP family class I SAM-dependent RNA methyltransferase [Caulobacter sp.]